MSRAYRLKLSASLDTSMKADDSVKSSLQMLPILAAEEMAGMLTTALKARGFVSGEDGKLVLEQGGVKIVVDPATNDCEITSNLCEKLNIKMEKDETRYEEEGTLEELQRKGDEKLEAEVMKEAENRVKALQEKATEQLQQALPEVQKVLGQAVSVATIEALKIKASRVGQIKSVVEDGENATIVVEV